MFINVLFLCGIIINISELDMHMIDYVFLPKSSTFNAITLD